MSRGDGINTSDLWHFCTILGKLCEVTSLLDDDPNYTKEDAVEGLKEVMHEMDPLYQRAILGGRRSRVKAMDKQALIEHLDTCIQLSEAKDETKVADVLRNLKADINSGVFDKSKN